MLFGNVSGGLKKRDDKEHEKESVKSGATNKSKNYNKRINCDLCGKEMRSDTLKKHRGSTHCHR